MGNMIQIKHGEELTTLYAHLSEINVQEGDTVVRGQRIGRIGDTGNAIGSHLHFEFITSDGRKGESRLAPCIRHYAAAVARPSVCDS